MKKKISKLTIYDEIFSEINRPKQEINLSKREATYVLFNHFEQSKRNHMLKEDWVQYVTSPESFDLSKISKRLSDLSNSFFEENGELPSENSKKTLIKFLSRMNCFLLPSITLSPKGFFSVRWILQKNKIVLCFNENNYVEYLVLTFIKDAHHEVFEGFVDIETFMEYFGDLVKRILK
jgi:hypothetical protein